MRLNSRDGESPANFHINSLPRMGCGGYFKSNSSKRIIQNSILAWCRQTWRQYPYQCLPRSVLLYQFTRRQWVDITATDTDRLNWEIHCNPGYLQISFLLGHSTDGDNEVDVTQYAWNINLPEDTKPYLELCNILSHMCAKFVQLPFYSKQWLVKGF